jgi:hypothetical protein
MMCCTDIYTALTAVRIEIMIFMNRMPSVLNDLFVSIFIQGPSDLKMIVAMSSGMLVVLG